MNPRETLDSGGRINHAAKKLIADVYLYITAHFGEIELIIWTDSRKAHYWNSVHYAIKNDRLVVTENAHVKHWLSNRRRDPNEAEPHVYQIDFKVPGTRTRPSSSVGGLAIESRDLPLSPVLPTIILLAQTLRHLVTRAHTAFVKNKIELLEDALDQCAQQGRGHRKTISKITAKLWQYLMCDAAYYITVHNGSGLVEFGATLSQRGFGIKSDPFPLSHSFLDQLSRGQPFYSSEHSRAQVLPLSQRHTCKSTVLPIHSNDGVIGMFVCEFWQDRPPPRLLESAKVHQWLNTLFANDAQEIYEWRTGTMIVNPLYRGRVEGVVQGRACALMPFTESWSDRVWTKALQPVLQDSGFDPMRADDLYGHDVMEDIWTMILSSEIIIADTTNRNANVFYELGIAHAIGKRVILLTQSVADIPFDLNRYRHVVYEDNVDGFEKLKSEVTKYLSEAIAARE